MEASFKVNSNDKQKRILQFILRDFDPDEDNFDDCQKKILEICKKGNTPIFTIKISHLPSHKLKEDFPKLCKQLFKNLKTQNRDLFEQEKYIEIQNLG